MNEVWLRIGLIAGALAVAALATVVLRSRMTGRPRALEVTGLEPGIYLFTSAECPDCSSARMTLIDELGETGFVELRWEQEPGVFQRLDVDSVPATAIVGADGSATLWPGRPTDVLKSIGP
jgi:hypothetical protein